MSETKYTNIGEFTEGRVLKTWDEGNPQSRDSKKEKSNVWVPIDDDSFVRESL